MSLIFEWDEAKAEANREKHGISFDEAISVFGDPFSMTIHDSAHSEGESRYVDIGTSSSGHLLVVVYSERRDRIRIISCRGATSIERVQYERRDP